MGKIRFWIRKTFGFSQKETNGFMILSTLIALLLFAPPLFNQFYNSHQTVFAKDQLILDSIVLNWHKAPIKKYKKEFALTTCASFDPNQVDKKTLLAFLGKKVTDNIIKYRNKGGQFHCSEDLKKIYGMTDSLYESIKECIVISSVSKKNKDATLAPFDINKVDSIELLKIKGIGKVLSSRIIRFREKLGGFVSIYQLGEVYGLDSLLVKELISKSFIRKDFIPVLINLNHAEASQLYSHPYIGKVASQKILMLRRKGKITLADLKSSAIFTPEKLVQAIPYLEF